jgi:type II secretory pathway component GspD/PulD (secretin)
MIRECSCYKGSMKAALICPAILVVIALLVGCSEATRDNKWASDPGASDPKLTTFSSLDRLSAKAQSTLPPGTIKLTDTDLDAVFNLYQSISKRTVIRPAALPPAKITLRTEQPVSAQKALQMLDTALALNGIAMIPQGSDMVKAVPANTAYLEAVPVCQLAPEELPESSSYTHYVVHLKNHKPSEMAQALQPLAKLPNSILGMDKTQTLVLRDYAVNVRRMLQMIEDFETNRPAPPSGDVVETNDGKPKSTK